MKVIAMHKTLMDIKEMTHVNSITVNYTANTVTIVYGTQGQYTQTYSRDDYNIFIIAT